MLETLLVTAQTVVLPIAVAIVTAQVTLRAGRQQIVSAARQDAARREHETELHARDAEAQRHQVRGEVLEQISDAIDDYKRRPNRGTDAVERAFFRLSSRCSAQHVADKCRRYVEVAAAVPDSSWVATAMDDARRRLVGWHLGHLDLREVENFIVEATSEIEEHVRSHHPIEWRLLSEGEETALAQVQQSGKP
ncbi:hypothetical protein [Curtobacterium sp. JUb34]|uniref:hypothetical protein n=1 Tax=Curtobacterium sp. JUb34 TaxID=2485109 RepID=UPI0011CE1A07|nr:hypothetical protein [Curtobacterium sp. JUb34]